MFEGSSLYFPLGKHFLDLETVKFIEENLKKFPLEDITIGDAGEVNNCQVGRLVEDHPESYPRQVNNEYSDELLEIFRSDKAKNFFERFLPKKGDQTIRRCQFNLLKKGSYVGRHLDTDSNPDYEIACVLQLGNSFEGGEFIVYPNKKSDDSNAQIISPEYGSITISMCKVEHAVKEVKKGTRTSLVTFISKDSGKNKRKKVA